MLNTAYTQCFGGAGKNSHGVPMEIIDITTYAGISAGTLIVIEVLKKLFVDFSLKQYKWYPSALNLATLFVAFALSFSSMLIIEGIEMYTVIGNGIIGFLMAVGGYEPIVNLLRGFFKKPKQ